MHKLIHDLTIIFGHFHGLMLHVSDELLHMSTTIMVLII